MKKNELINKYLELVEVFHSQYLKEEKILFRLSMFRLLVFLVGIGLSGYLFTSSTLAGSICSLAFITIFIILIKNYSTHSVKKGQFENLHSINRNEVKALNNDFSPFQDGNQWIDDKHDFSNDIDLFGKGSLFNYLNRTVTGYGNKLLANWLANPFILSDKINERQQVIKELSMKLTWRQEFIARGMGKSLEEKDIKSLLVWLNEEEKFFKITVGKFGIFLLPAISILCFGLVIAGVLHYSIFTSLFIFNLTLVGFRLRSVNKIHANLSNKYNFLVSFGSLLATFEKEPFVSPALIKIKSEISSSSDDALLRLRQLSRIIQAFDNRMNILVGFFLNGLLLWDFQCVYKLEKWKFKSKNHLPLWLNYLGEVDAYISLANYAFNNAEFAYPTISTNKTILAAKNLGHPLIPEESRICNDFNLSGSGQICIITGANMAGKSTFLRTIAVNYILGMVGAPVCASETEFTPCMLFTSMRTTDSLGQNESYFYAELKRLKLLKMKLEEGIKILFILDEILKGTNSTDKAIGSKLFLRKVISLGGTGLIATHDTSLGEMESEFPELVTNNCFEIEINGENILFDYKLRNGITQKMNASLLMRQMGLTE